MSRLFGWDLPPGCTMGHLEAAMGGDGPCLTCGNHVDDCTCPECTTCGDVGNPNCYEKHGLTFTPEQIEGQAYLEHAEREQARAEDAEAAYYAQQPKEDM